MDLIIERLKKLGGPITRERYIWNAYPDGAPVPWSAEAEDDLPPELQNWERFYRNARRRQRYAEQRYGAWAREQVDAMAKWSRPELYEQAACAGALAQLAMRNDPPVPGSRKATSSSRPRSPNWGILWRRAAFYGFVWGATLAVLLGLVWLYRIAGIEAMWIAAGAIIVLALWMESRVPVYYSSDLWWLGERLPPPSTGALPPPGPRQITSQHRRALPKR
jgi:hypothetical protein